MPSGTFHTAGCVSFRPGTFPCGRGHSTPSGTGFLSPYARHVPGREKMHPHAQAVPDREGMHPHAQGVPVETGRPGPVPNQHRACAEQYQASTSQALTQRPI